MCRWPYAPTAVRRGYVKGERNAAYVIKKNEENRAEKLITKELQTLLAVPGTRRMGFVIV